MKKIYVLLFLIFQTGTIKSSDYQDECCSVCFQVLYDNKQAITIPPCNKQYKHAFHVACLDMWQEKKQTCPLCRGIMPQQKKMDTIKLLQRKLETEQLLKQQLATIIFSSLPKRHVHKKFCTEDLMLGSMLGGAVALSASISALIIYMLL